MIPRSARCAVAAVGAVLTGAVLAGCSSTGTEVTSAEATSATASGAPATGAAASGAADSASSAPVAPDTSRPGADAAGEGVGQGGRCDIGQRYTTGLVVGGSIDCSTLNDVWAQAVADPAFARHGNRNTIVVGDWTCRAHQTRPVQTGYCENTVSYGKFKVIHT